MLKIKWVLGILIILALLIGSSVPFLVGTSPTVAENENPYVVETFVDEEGNSISVIDFPEKPPEVKAAAVSVPEPNIQMGINVLTDVPAFDWCYGCSATSAAMLFGYYDRTGYDNMYAGPTNGGVCPLDNSAWGSGECSLSATHQGYDGLGTKGNVDDYWYAYSSQLDPYYDSNPPWTQHTYADCTADFMGTNQYQNWHCSDGGTYFFFDDNGDPVYDFTGWEGLGYRDGCHGMRLFAESRGYSVVTNFNQYIEGQAPLDPNNGFTFVDFMAEIDAGRPVIIQVQGHSMLGYGYNTDGEIVYIHDTWDHSSHTMTWGGTYSGLQHFAVAVIQLEELASPGLLRIATSPALPTTIFLDGFPRNGFGLDWVKMPAGSYMLSFSDVPGYLTPTTVDVTYYPGGGPVSHPLTDPITILADTTTEVIVNFTQLGSLRMETSPALPATISVDGIPMNDWGFWVSLGAGQYLVSFESIGYGTTPDPILVAVNPGATTYVIANYDTGEATIVP